MTSRLIASWTASSVTSAVMLIGAVSPAVAQENHSASGRLRPSPEQVSRQLQGDRQVPSIEPAGTGAGGYRPPSVDLRKLARPEDENRLLPEDYPVSSAEGTLHHRQGQWYYRFSSAPDRFFRGEMPVLRNSQLEKMERYLVGSVKEVRFSVAGVVTEYDNHNYLLVRDVAILRTAAAPQQNSGKSADTNPEDAADSVEQLIRAMQEEGHALETLPTLPDQTQSRDNRIPPPVAPPHDARGTWPEDSQQLERLGRLIRQDDHWLFAFDSDSEQPTDPPIELLPNLSLQRMQQLSSAGTVPVQFKVSGDITEYAGRNFMLVRRFTVYRDQGNLQ